MLLTGALVVITSLGVKGSAGKYFLPGGFKRVASVVACTVAIFVLITQVHYSVFLKFAEDLIPQPYIQFKLREGPLCCLVLFSRLRRSIEYEAVSHLTPHRDQ